MSKITMGSKRSIELDHTASILNKRQIIGWREWIEFPSLHDTYIKAKIDTGARTSSIHAWNIRAFSDGGTPYVSFVLHPVQRRKLPEVECVAEIHDERSVTSSSGHKERRYVIKQTVKLKGVEWPIELTLANRDLLGFRVLLGREALRKKFLVDPGRSFLGGRCIGDASTSSIKKGIKS